MRPRTKGSEDGAVLLIVLVALALLAGLAVATTRTGRAELVAMTGERQVALRGDLLTSALAVVAARMSGDDALARNGKPEILALPGGTVEVRLQAAAGLVNPNSTSAPTLLSALMALGAQPAEATTLVNAILARRRASPGARAFADKYELAVLFADDARLWSRLAPNVTLLGMARDLDPSTAPEALQPAAVRTGETFDLGALPGRFEREGLFELSLRLTAAGAVPTEAHAALLVERSGKVHVLRLDWPRAVGG